jgi:hypothetical protein
MSKRPYDLTDTGNENWEWNRIGIGIKVNIQMIDMTELNSIWPISPWISSNQA